jgi:Ca-activated chloride channel family protein
MTTVRHHALVFGLASCVVAGAGALAFVHASASPPGQQSRQDLPTFSSSESVRRVVLYATVRGDEGFVADLTASDFTIFEDGKPQKLLEFQREDVPVAIGLLVDNSRSMLTRRDAVVEAAKTFVRATNPQDDIFVLHFNEQLSYGLPKDVAFTADRALLGEALDRMRLDGQTALYAAIAEGLTHLGRSNLTKKALIVISDGGDNVSRITLDDVVTQADLSGASFYGIGIYDKDDGEADPKTLRKLATRTGGESFFPEQLDEVRSLCERIALTMRNQYTLSYSPPTVDTKPTYHRIEVKVKDPRKRKLTVRTRTGYYTAPVAP